MINFLRDLFDPAVFSGARRSRTWRKTKREFAKIHPKICPFGCTKKIELHHKVPFHVAPHLEEVFSNLMWLCRKHHFEWGHLNNFHSHNMDVVADTEWFKEKIKNRP